MPRENIQGNNLRDDFEEIYNKYFDNVYKIAFVHTKHSEASLDISQEVFVKFLICKKDFESEEHIKAWLLTCAHNSTMDYFRSRHRKEVSLDEISETVAVPLKVDETLKILLTLPEKYKTPLYMYYYEGYKTEEIAKMLKKPHSTIRVTLKRARELLREKIGKEAEDNE